jgi:hypothetical protein
MTTLPPITPGDSVQDEDEHRAYSAHVAKDIFRILLAEVEEIGMDYDGTKTFHATHSMLHEYGAYYDTSEHRDCVRCYDHVAAIREIISVVRSAYLTSASRGKSATVCMDDAAAALDEHAVASLARETGVRPRQSRVDIAASERDISTSEMQKHIAPLDPVGDARQEKDIAFFELKLNSEYSINPVLAEWYAMRYLTADEVRKSEHLDAPFIRDLCRRMDARRA